MGIDVVGPARTKPTLEGAGGIEGLQAAVAGLWTPRRFVIALVATAVVFGLHVNRSWRVTPDSGLYLSLARSLNEAGAYRFGGETHTLVPPGYPLLLAGVRALVGDHFLGLRVVHAAMGWLSTVVAFLAMRRLYGRDVAFAVFLLFAVSHSLVKRSACFLSDVPFALVVWLVLLAVVYAATAKRYRWVLALVAGVGLQVAMLVRINGWGLVPPVLLFLWLAWWGEGLRRYGRLLLVSAVAVAVPLFWMIWTLAVAVPGKLTYVQAVLSRGPAFFRVWLDGLMGYPHAMAVAIMGFPDVPPVVDLVVLVPAAIGLVVCLRGGRVLLALLVLFQWVGLALSTPGERYLIAVLPALHLLGLVGLALLVNGLKSRRRALLLALCGGLVAINVGRDAKSIWEAHTAVPHGAEPADKQYWFDAAAALRQRLAGAPESALIVTQQVTIAHYLTRARCLSPWALADMDQVPTSGLYVLLGGENETAWDDVRDFAERTGARIQTLQHYGPLRLARIVARPSEFSGPVPTRK